MSVKSANLKDITAIGMDTCPAQWPIYYRSIFVHETDKDGVVHFSNYCKIAEEAMYTGFWAFGCSFKESQYSLAMLNTTLNYFHPLKFGDRIAVVLDDFDMKRVKYFLTLKFQNNFNICAEIKLTLATILSKERKVIPVPLIIKERLSAAISKKC